MVREVEMPSVEDFSEQLLSTSRDMKELAFTYYEARKNYAKCFNKITVMVYIQIKPLLKIKSLCFLQIRFIQMRQSPPPQK